MAFWGIEVKPGKSYTHSYDESQGRLHISQATLGFGKGTVKSVLQCNVGGRSPVLLCSLFPDRSESCHLELEFEEDDDVVFSVLGPRSVHLTGFFVGSKHRGYNYDDEIEPYGEEIGEEDSSDSYDSEEDDYESDFIDDSSMELFPSSPPKSSVVIEEIIEDDKQTNGNTNHRRLKKKYQFSDTDDDKCDSHNVIVKPNPPTEIESEDEDGFPVSSNLKSKSTVEGKIRAAAETVDEDRKRKIIEDVKQINGNANHRRLKKKYQFSDTDDDKSDSHKVIVKPDPPTELESEDEDGFPVSSNLKSISTVEGKIKAAAKTVDKDRKRKINYAGENTDTARENCQLGYSSVPLVDSVEDGGMQRKRKKDKEGKPFVDLAKESTNKIGSEPNQDINDKNKDDAKRTGILKNFSSEEKEEAVISDPNNVSMTDNANQGNPSEAEKLPDSRVDSKGKSRKKQKKNRNKVIKYENHQDLVGSTMEISVKDIQEDKHPMSEDILTTADADLQKASEDSSVIDEDLATTKDNVCDGKAEKKTKKKKKRNKDLGKDMNTDHKSLNLLAAEEKVEPRKVRNYSNGLTVEELSMGKPDGKKASPGSKVSINYIGKLQNGTVFESNIGERPFQFLLGIGQVIKGWDVGVKGMRLGDKRRITIPPSMGYHEENGKDKPVNSWIVYDVELVDVQ